MLLSWNRPGVFLAGLAFASAAAGCGGGKEPPGSEAGIPVIRVGHVGHDHQIALYIAALDGAAFRDKYGLWLREKKPREVYDLVEGEAVLAEIHLLKVGGGSQMTASMERGEIDVGCGGVGAVVFFRDKGSPFKILCPMHTGGDMLVVRPDLPASDWPSFADFLRKTDKPMKIGYKDPVAVAKLIFVRALKEEGISCSAAGPETASAPDGRTRVELVNLQGEKNMVPSLASGSIDGFVANQPHASMASHRGTGRIMADLSDLPPAGRWKNHPCCCVSANEKTIEKHRTPMKALVKLIMLATIRIKEDKQRAAALASEWTKVDLAVEKDSVSSIEYLAEFTDDWNRGLLVWGEMMDEIGKFSGAMKGRTGRAFLDEVCDTSLAAEAMAEMRKAGLIK